METLNADGQQGHNQEIKTRTMAELLVQCLENEGVRYIFGVPGEENIEILDAIRESGIRFILTRHEQGAAFMADVYGRLTHQAGVCLSTLGPGATNLITGVADANEDGVPLVAITGQVATSLMHLTSHQFLDLTELFRPITKRTKIAIQPDSINEIVRIAFKYAQSERPGATHIDIPVDISQKQVSLEEKPLLINQETKEDADLQSIESAAAMIFKARTPVILAGGQAARTDVSEALTKFCTLLKIPVVNTMMAKGIVPCDNPYAMMTIGMPFQDYVDAIMASADLVIAVGYDLIELSPRHWNADKKPREIIHISTGAAHTNKFYQCEVQVIGDIAGSLQKIALRATRNKENLEAAKIKAAFNKRIGPYRTDDSYPVKPQRAVFDIRKAMGEDDILISDVGAHKIWFGRLYGCYKPNTCIISNGFATMGIGVPGAVAAKLLFPERKVLTVTGDGGFMMNNQELETAVRLGLNFVVVIFNDANYGLIKWKQQNAGKKVFGVGFTNPDFVKMAESMHCKGVRIEKTEDLLPAIERAFSEKVPVIIDMPVDYDENPKLSQHLKTGLNIASTAF